MIEINIFFLKNQNNKNNALLEKIQILEKQKQLFQKDISKFKQELNEKNAIIKTQREKIDSFQKLNDSQAEIFKELQKKEPFFAENKSLRNEINELELRNDALMSQIEKLIMEKQSMFIKIKRIFVPFKLYYVLKNYLNYFFNIFI